MVIGTVKAYDHSISNKFLNQTRCFFELGMNIPTYRKGDELPMNKRDALKKLIKYNTFKYRRVSDSAINRPRTLATNLNIGMSIEDITRVLGDLPCSIETTKGYIKFHSD